MAKGKVAVVGLGPAGSFAARAAYDAGYDVVIYQYGEVRKTPPGAFWLHWIPDNIMPDYDYTDIYISGVGKEKNYIKTQWRSLAAGIPRSSFPTTPVWERGYNPVEVLEDLVPDSCEIFFVAHPLSDTDIEDLTLGYDHVFQTFPTKQHRAEQPPLLSFVAAARFATEDPSENWVIYNGTGRGVTVREAQLFGNRFLEFPKSMPIEQVKQALPSTFLDGWHWVELKDLHPSTQPVTHPNPKVHLIGRMAEWNRQRLSHEVYSSVSGLLK